MSILIGGMEMPKENDYTIAIVYGDGVVTEYHDDYWIRGADGEKQLGTAVPVPPHGRLIDADEMKESIRKQTAFLRLMGGEFIEIAEALERGFLQEIDNAPTIIEEEEGET